MGLLIAAMLFLVGLITLVKGELKLSRKKVSRGVWARLAGILMMLSLPITVVLNTVARLAMSLKGEPVSLEAAPMWLLLLPYFVMVGVTVIAFLVAALGTKVPESPQSQERRAFLANAVGAIIACLVLAGGVYWWWNQSQLHSSAAPSGRPVPAITALKDDWGSAHSERALRFPARNPLSASLPTVDEKTAIAEFQAEVNAMGLWIAEAEESMGTAKAGATARMGAMYSELATLGTDDLPADLKGAWNEMSALFAEMGDVFKGAQPPEPARLQDPPDVDESIERMLNLTSNIRAMPFKMSAINAKLEPVTKKVEKLSKKYGLDISKLAHFIKMDGAGR